MELRQLRYFATVARELNFTRAAARLHVAQPALSRQVKQLEEELGVALLVRDNRGVALTAAGRKFLAETESILQQTDRAMRSARDGEQRALNIGYVWGLFHSTVPPALQKFRQMEPTISVNLLDLSAVEQGRALAAGRLDAGFIGLAFEAEAARLDKERVESTRFVITLPKSHPLAKARRVKLKELEGEVFLLISDEHFPGASQVMLRACAKAGFKPRVLQVAERGHTILSLVGAGCGVALLPEPLTALPHANIVFREPVEPVTADLFLAFRIGFDPALRKSLLHAVGQTR